MSYKWFLECQLNAIVVESVLDYPNSDYPNAQLSEHLDVAMFLAAVGKRCSHYWSAVTGESKAAVNNFSRMLHCLFQPVRDLEHNF